MWGFAGIAMEAMDLLTVYPNRNPHYPQRANLSNPTANTLQLHSQINGAASGLWHLCLADCVLVDISSRQKRAEPLWDDAAWTPSTTHSALSSQCISHHRCCPFRLFAFTESLCRGCLSKPSEVQSHAVLDEVVMEGLQLFPRQPLHTDLGSTVPTTQLLTCSRQASRGLFVSQRVIHWLYFPAKRALQVIIRKDEWVGTGWLTRILKDGPAARVTSSTTASQTTDCITHPNLCWGGDTPAAFCPPLDELALIIHTSKQHKEAVFSPKVSPFLVVIVRFLISLQ